MRTAGQGQAAVPGERVRRRRSDGLPEPSVLGRWEKISRTVTKVERYPEVPGLRLGASGFAVGRAAAHRGFVLREWGSVCPQTDTRSIPDSPPAGERRIKRDFFRREFL